MTKTTDKNKGTTALVKREETQLSKASGEKLADYKEELALAAEIYKARKEFLMSQLKEGVHYGTEEGIDKPFLHKPGAETVNTVMEQYPVFRQVKEEMDRETGWVRQVIECDILKKGTNEMVVQGFRAAANSFEKGKRFYWMGKGPDRKRHEKNAKDLLGDDHNILTMAEKRAHVGASIIAAGISDQFTYAPEMVDKNGKAKGPPCPLCKVGVLKERTAKSGQNKGGKFWGCSNYFSKGERKCDWAQSEEPGKAKDCKHERQKALPDGLILCQNCGECPAEPQNKAAETTSTADTSHPADQAPLSVKMDDLCPQCGEEPKDPNGICHNKDEKKGAPKSEAVALPKCTDCGNNLLPCIAKNGHHYFGHKTGSCKGTAQMTEEEKDKVWPNRSKK